MGLLIFLKRSLFMAISAASSGRSRKNRSDLIIALSHLLICVGFSEIFCWVVTYPWNGRGNTSPRKAKLRNPSRSAMTVAAGSSTTAATPPLLIAKILSPGFVPRDIFVTSLADRPERSTNNVVNLSSLSPISATPIFFPLRSEV